MQEPSEGSVSHVSLAVGTINPLNPEPLDPEPCACLGVQRLLEL